MEENVMNVRFPIYVPVRMQEPVDWQKEQSVRTRKIHKLVEEAFEVGWKNCFDVPAFFSGIVCSISPDFRIGDGLINLSKEQGEQFRERFDKTTDKIVEIFETSNLWEVEDCLKDLLWGRKVILEDGQVWERKNEEDEEDD